MATTSSSKRQLIHTSNTYESNSDLTVGGDLFVNGATTTIDTANLLVEDKNIIIGNVSSPSDTTADGGGITLKGASDYTINWTNSTNQWYFNQGINITGQLDVSTNLNVGGYGTLTGLDINGNSQFDGAVTVGVNDTGHDVKFFGATSGRYLLWDESANALTGVYDLKLADSRELQIGEGNDLRLYHSHPHSYIVQGNSGGSLYIRSHNTIQLESNDGEDMITCAANGAVTLHYDAASHLQTTSTGVNITGALSVDNVDFPNSGKARFGASDQLQIYHDGSNSYIDNITNDLLIRNTSASKDIIFYSNNGTSTIESLRIDGSGQDLNSRLNLHGGDASLYPYITGFVAPQNPEGHHIKCPYFFNDLAYARLRGATVTVTVTGGSSPSTTNIDRMLDASTYFWSQTTSGVSEIVITMENLPKNFTHTTHMGITFGNEGWRAKNVKLEAYYSNQWNTLKDVTNQTEEYVHIRHNTGGNAQTKLRWTLSNFQTTSIRIASIYCYNYSSNGMSDLYVTRDGGNVYGDIAFQDSKYATFGEGLDLSIGHDGSNSYISENGTGDLYLDSNDSSIYLRDSNGGNVMLAAKGGSAEKVELYYGGGKKLETTSDGISLHGNGYVDLPDNGRLRLGANMDMLFYHNGTSLNILDFQNHDGLIRNLTNDKLFIFQTTSGGTQYEILRLGGSAVDAKFSQHVSIGSSATPKDLTAYGSTSVRYIKWDGSADTLNFRDDVKATFGDGDDLQIFHDGSHSYIDDTGTGDLILRGNDQVKIQGYNNSHNMAVLNKGGSVDLYYDNVKKFETTSAGVYVNGSLGVGVSAPAQKLHIEFADTDTSFSGGNGGAWGSEGLLIENTSSTTDTMAMIQLRTGDADLHIAGIRQGQNDNDLGFFFESQEKVRFTKDGHVGIGTTSPSSQFYNNLVVGNNTSGEKGITIRSNASNGGHLAFSDTDSQDAGRYAGRISYFHDTNSMRFYTTAGDFAMAIDSSQRVGIGTATPSRTLHVYDSAGPTIKFERGTASNLEFTFGSTNASIVSAGEIQFRANGGTTNKFIINNSQIQSNAKFLVNTDSGIDVHTDDDGNILLSGNSSATGTPDQFFLKHNLGGVELGNSRGKTTVTTGDFQINTQFRLTSSGSGLTVIRHNGTNNYYENYTGNVHFFQHDADKSIYFHSDDGSGNTAEYYRVDGLNLRNVFSKGVDITGSLTTTATFGNRSTNQGINFETPTTALQTARVDSDAFRFYFGGTGGGQEVFRLEENGDLDVSGQIDSKNRKHKKYTSLTGSSGDWFPLFQVGDHHGGQVLFNINTYAHSSCTFIVSEGYGPSGQSANPAHISVLNYLYNANGGYANITGIRVKQDGFVEIRLNWSSGPSVDIDVTAETSELVQYGFVSSLATSTNSEAVVDTALLDNKRARFKNLEVDDRLFTSIGSATAPAICFTDDSDTGIYGATNNHLYITTGSAVRATFNSSGITSASNLYSGSNGQFRNYGGVWKATTGTSGNGFQFVSADATAMTLSSTGALNVTQGGEFLGGTLNLHTAGNINYISSQDASKDLVIRNTGSGKDMVLQVTAGGTSELLRLRGVSSKEIVSSANFEIRNGSSARHINLYETYTDSSNYERTTFEYSSGYLNIDANSSGTGTTSGIKLGANGYTFLQLEPEGHVLINGADDNNNTADFAVATGGGDPTITWRNDQVQIGHGDMNWEGKVFEKDGLFQIAAWARNMRFYSQNSSGTSALDFIFSPWDGSNLTERVRIKGDGKVGIGTTSPVGKLTVIDTTSSSTTQKFHVGRSTNAGLYFSDSDSTSYIRAIQDEDQAGYGNLTLVADNSGNRDGYISFEASGERVRIKSNGNVGIGTTNPVQRLQAVGSIYANTGHFYVDNDKSLTSVGTLRLRTNNGTTAIIADTAQKVGLGCAAQVNSKASVFIKGEDNSPTLNGSAVDDATLILTNSYTTDPYGLCFGVNTSGTSLVQSRRLGSETYFKLALNPYGGNVGIGTDDPVQELEVDGVIKQKVYTVSTLPSAGSGTIGARAFVSDSYYAFSSSYLGSQISGGGSNFSPVYSDGNYWYMG